MEFSGIGVIKVYPLFCILDNKSAFAIRIIELTITALCGII